MPTIIDSLVVSLSLDASKFNDEQKKAVEQLRQFGDAAEKHTKPVNKGMQDLVGTFKQMQGALLAIGALIATGLGFNRLVQDVTRLNNELGKTSAQLGMSAKDISAWEHVGRTIGASAGEMTGALALMNEQVQHLKKYGWAPMRTMMGQVQAEQLNRNDTAESGLMKWADWASKHPDKQYAASVLREQGFSGNQVTALMQGREKLNKELEFGRRFGPTDADIKQFTKLQEAFGNLLTVVERLTTKAILPFVNALTKILEMLTRWLGKWAENNQTPAEAAGEGMAQLGMPELRQKKGEPGIFGGVWNWMRGKGWRGDQGDQGGGASNDNAPSGGATRGDRNNNPGNLKFTGGAGSIAKAFGATGADDRGFAIFPDWQSGMAAHEALVKSSAYSGLTLSQFANKYAEGSPDWIKTVGKGMGIGPNDIVDNNDPRLLESIRKAEGTGQGRRTASTSTAPASLTGDDVQAFIMHHTGGRGDVGGVQSTLRQRGLGVEYIMDRDGNITVAGGRGASHMMSGWGKGAGLNNRNTVGMEVIARDNKDVTPAQIKAAQEFIRKNYPNTAVYGHGEVNPGHKEADEGMAIVDAIRVERMLRNSLSSGGAQGGPSFDDRWRALGLGARGATIRGGDQSSIDNSSTSSTHVENMHVTVPPGASPSAYGDGIQRRLSDFNNVQNSNTGLV